MAIRTAPEKKMADAMPDESFGHRAARGRSANSDRARHMNRRVHETRLSNRPLARRNAGGEMSDDMRGDRAPDATLRLNLQYLRFVSQCSHT